MEIKLALDFEPWLESMLANILECTLAEFLE